jgi:hypothetical protein
VNAKLRQKCRRRKRRMLRRIDKLRSVTHTPMLRPQRAKYELAEKSRAVACGGLGMILELIKQTGLRNQINRAVSVLKQHAPYDEADHVLNIALNLLTGGTCLEHLELRRTDEAYLDALGAPRIPDPTTAGDFCRRFDPVTTLFLQTAINRARQVVWRRQAPEFFAQATIEADGTMVETTGEKKAGIGLNYQGQWGYHPLVVTLAETKEVLYLANRSGNRPSHERAAFYFDLALDQCRQAGFRKLTLRGDTDFALTTNFDRWTDAGVEFVFGFDARDNLIQRADALETGAWTALRRGKRPTGEPRARRPEYKEQFVVEHNYKNLRLQGESYAEFDYQPTACDRSYRVIVLRKELEEWQGQQLLFPKQRDFFFITNAKRSELSARQVIAAAHQRCDQENTLSQLKACHALAAPLDSLESNEAYMVIASLAWTLKVWSGLAVLPAGRKERREEEQAVRQRVLRIEFATYLNSVLLIPAQVIRTARQTIYRLLTYRPSVDLLLTLHAQVSRARRC